MMTGKGVKIGGIFSQKIKKVVTRDNTKKGGRLINI